MNDAKFPIGTEFLSNGTHPKVYNVTDILKTYNSAGELVKIEYIAEHEFFNQKLETRSTETGVAIGIDKLETLRFNMTIRNK